MPSERTMTIVVTLVSVSLALTGVVLSQQWSAATSIGRMEGDLVALRAQASDNAQEIEDRFGRLSSQLDDLITTADRIEKQIAADSVDPSSLLAHFGVNAMNDGTLALIAGQSVVSPLSLDGLKNYREAGFVLVMVAPGVTGLTQNDATAAIITEAVSTLAERDEWISMTPDP